VIVSTGTSEIDRFLLTITGGTGTTGRRSARILRPWLLLLTLPT
jgi:hypothetical protein